MRIRSQIRGPGLFGRPGWTRYLSLKTGCPLILERDRDNSNDPNAIIVLAVTGEPVGYVRRQEAALIAPSLGAGDVWIAKVTRPVLRVGDRRVAWAELTAWREAPPEVFAETRRTMEVV